MVDFCYFCFCLESTGPPYLLYTIFVFGFVQISQFNGFSEFGYLFGEGNIVGAKTIF